MKKTPEKMNEILTTIKNIPIVSFTCSKTSVSRNSLYRWLIEDKTFAKQFKVALKEGEENLNDYCETNLIKKIKEGNMQAIIFWLKSHKKIYKPKSYIVINNPKK